MISARPPGDEHRQFRHLPASADVLPNPLQLGAGLPPHTGWLAGKVANLGSDGRTSYQPIDQAFLGKVQYNYSLDRTKLLGFDRGKLWRASDNIAWNNWTDHKKDPQPRKVETDPVLHAGCARICGVDARHGRPPGGCACRPVATA